MQNCDISFSRIAEPSGVEVIFGNDIFHSFPPHSHGVYCIGLVEKGRRAINTKISNQIVSAGDIFIINPGQVHACSSPDGKPHTYRMLCVDKAVLNQFSSKSDTQDFRVRFNSLKISDRELFNGLSKLCDLLLSEEPGYVKLSAFNSMIEDLICNYGECPIHNEMTERATIKVAREFLENNVTESISIDDIASACGVSPFHLTRSFKTQIGVTPHVYQMHGRIKRAKNLLTKGIPIAQIAVESGFHDQSHFTKTFKRFMGITPCRYAAKIQTK